MFRAILLIVGVTILVVGLAQQRRFKAVSTVAKKVSVEQALALLKDDDPAYVSVEAQGDADHKI